MRLITIARTILKTCLYFQKMFSFKNKCIIYSRERSFGFSLWKQNWIEFSKCKYFCTHSNLCFGICVLNILLHKLSFIWEWWGKRYTCSIVWTKFVNTIPTGSSEGFLQPYLPSENIHKYSFLHLIFCNCLVFQYPFRAQQKLMVPIPPHFHLILHGYS